MKILAICVGMPREMASPARDASEAGSWSSGIFKVPTDGPVELGITNLAGDGQADLKHHGGPDRSLLMFSVQNYPRWEARLGRDLEPGSFGENLTIEGADEESVCLGDRWIGANVEIEVSQPRLPCFKLSRRLNVDGFHEEMMPSERAGWYSRTIVSGTLTPGEQLSLAARPHPDWTVRRAFSTYMLEKRSVELLRSLCALPCLSELWKEGLGRRIRFIEEGPTIERQP